MVSHSTFLEALRILPLIAITMTTTHTSGLNVTDVAAAQDGLSVESKKQDRDVQIERVLSPDAFEKQDHMNYDRVDKELAKYTNAERIEISESENKRLKTMIDKRVLAIMIITYFVQALDKGTMSFASIMGIVKDLDLHGQQVSACHKR